jgi:hypothetical protein
MSGERARVLGGGMGAHEPVRRRFGCSSPRGGEAFATGHSVLRDRPLTGTGRVALTCAPLFPDTNARFARSLQ